MEEKYAVLDPSLGTYKTDLTIEEARQAFESAIKNMFNSQPFTVNKCITNENGEEVIAIRQKMFISHSYDHRVVDGSLGGGFVKRVSDYLEKFSLDTQI
jgi:hypothetical protein